eukprot:364198-Chlamydomonas_euryale.AAC.22
MGFRPSPPSTFECGSHAPTQTMGFWPPLPTFECVSGLPPPPPSSAAAMPPRRQWLSGLPPPTFECGSHAATIMHAFVYPARTM